MACEWRHRLEIGLVILPFPRPRFGQAIANRGYADDIFLYPPFLVKISCPSPHSNVCCPLRPQIGVPPLGLLTCINSLPILTTTVHCSELNQVLERESLCKCMLNTEHKVFKPKDKKRSNLCNLNREKSVVPFAPLTPRPQVW